MHFHPCSSLLPSIWCEAEGPGAASALLRSFCNENTWPALWCHNLSIGRVYKSGPDCTHTKPSHCSQAIAAGMEHPQLITEYGSKFKTQEMARNHSSRSFLGLPWINNPISGVASGKLHGLLENPWNISTLSSMIFPVIDPIYRCVYIIYHAVIKCGNWKYHWRF